MYFCSLERMKDKIKTFSRFGATKGGGVTRYALSAEDISARKEFVRRMRAIGAKIKTDDLANIYAFLEGSEPGLPAIVMGSHSDSVKNGGNYDGILGVMGAMEALETVYYQKIPHRRTLVAMIWTNEEGSLYIPSMMCSGIVCGKYLPAQIAEKYKYEDMMRSPSVLDPDTTFEDALDSSGFKGDIKNRLTPKSFAAMLELHIEQGPVLEESGKNIGVVTCVIGSMVKYIRIYGQSDHAGTTPMKNRRDALWGCAKVLEYIHTELDKIGGGLVYTTGEISCHPNIHTVIPDYVQFTLDARHERPEMLDKVRAVLEKMPGELVGCRIECADGWTRDTVYYDKQLVNCVQAAADELGYSNRKINSGAGHDAQFVSYMLPTAMVFVPSKDGHSHCEDEYTSAELCTEGASVLLNAALKYDAMHCAQNN